MNMEPTWRITDVSQLPAGSYAQTSNSRVPSPTAEVSRSSSSSSSFPPAHQRIGSSSPSPSPTQQDQCQWLIASQAKRGYPEITICRITIKMPRSQLPSSFAVAPALLLEVVADDAPSAVGHLFSKSEIAQHIARFELVVAKHTSTSTLSGGATFLLDYKATFSFSASNLNGRNMKGFLLRAVLLQTHSDGMLLVVSEHRSPDALYRCSAALEREELSLAAANSLLSMHNGGGSSSEPPSSGTSLLGTRALAPPLPPPLSPRSAHHNATQAEPISAISDNAASPPDPEAVSSVWDCNSACPVEILRADLAAYLDRHPWCVEMTEENFLVL